MYQNQHQITKNADSIALFIIKYGKKHFHTLNY